MKKFLHTNLIVLLVMIANNAVSETVYNVTKNATLSSAKIPEQCENCIINIAEGVTLTINKELKLKNTVFNGGTVLANKPITFWSGGEFNNTSVVVKETSAITSSGNLLIKNSEFTFNGNSKGTFWSPLTMDNSKMKFLGNANMEATKTVDLKNNSSLVAGDGTTTSKAFIFFNGGTLNIYDTKSSVVVSNYTNYYRNWNDYNSISNNKTYVTKNNKLNCDATGKNACDAPNVYGPATMNFAGLASAALMPVKLSAFAVKLNGSTVEITWTTDMEQNADRFEIERSIDGIHWNKVGAVQSKGNSTLVNKYACTDVLKLNGNNSYRLKMIDQDGSFEYSVIKSVRSDAADVEMNIFPNPATNYVVINSKDNSNKNIQLFNQNGQVVKQVSGNGSINLSVSEFQAGNYIVRVSDSMGAAKSFKLIVKK